MFKEIVFVLMVVSDEPPFSLEFLRGTTQFSNEITAHGLVDYIYFLLVFVPSSFKHKINI